MKTVPQGHSVQSRLWSIASAATAILLAGYAAAFFMYLNVIWNPSYYGELGLSVNAGSHAVDEVVPGSPADRAGIKVGDTVEPPKTLRDRLILFPSWAAPHPNERITLSVSRGDKRRTLTLQARPLPPLPVTDRARLVLKSIWLSVFVAVGLILVLLRPSRMTWGFYLFALNLVTFFGPPNSFISYLPSGWLVIFNVAMDAIIGPAGVAGFLIFCVRFPANSPRGWRKAVENLTPFVFATIAAGGFYDDVSAVRFVAAPIDNYIVAAVGWTIFIVGTVVLLNVLFGRARARGHKTKWVVLGLASALAAAAVVDVLLKQPGFDSHPWLSIFMLGTAAFLITYFDARGLERQRIKWVVFGLVCALVATVVDLIWSIPLPRPAPFVASFELLYIVLPLAVAYAVIRHRVIDVRFVASRALALGVIASIVALIVIGIDWLFSTKLPASRLQAAVYVGLALVVGFSLNATWRSIGRTIDFLFFRQWYRTQEQSGAIDDAMRRATSTHDLHEPLTAGIADTFSLASVALFERVEDGGFVRVAARGWPAGTIWHILPDDPLIARAGDGRRVVDIDALRWQEPDLPAGVARPSVMLPIAAGRRGAAILLCGAHENGTALDPDEIGAIRRLCADAGLIYGRPPRLEAGRTAFLTEPLPV